MSKFCTFLAKKVRKFRRNFAPFARKNARARNREKRCLGDTFFSCDLLHKIKTRFRGDFFALFLRFLLKKTRKKVRKKCSKKGPKSAKICQILPLISSDFQFATFFTLSNCFLSQKNAIKNREKVKKVRISCEKVLRIEHFLH